jgi:hypothetical protein
MSDLDLDDPPTRNEDVVLIPDSQPPRRANSAIRGSVEKRKRPVPNNYFHIRVYTDDRSKLEIFRDKKQVSTRAEIIAGLKRAIELLERLDAPT